MEPPKNAEVHETLTGKFWFDEYGILYSVSKQDPPKLSPAEAKEQLDMFLKVFGQEKKCMLIDAKYAKPNTPQERKEAAEMLPKLVKAMAIIVHNALGRLAINLFIGLEKPTYPMKIFKPGEEDKAVEWLKKYL